MDKVDINLGPDVQDLSSEDHLFLQNLTRDVDLFCETHSLEYNQVRALVFPPLTPRYRFLLHKYIEVFKSPNLQTISVGKGYNRRPVIFAPKRNDSAMMASSPSVKNNAKGATPAIQLYRPPAARHASAAETKKDASDAAKRSSKNKRPDMALYVPKNRRSSSSDVSKPDKQTESCLPTQESDVVNTSLVPSEPTSDQSSPKNVKMLLEKEVNEMLLEKEVNEPNKQAVEDKEGVQNEEGYKGRDVKEEKPKAVSPEVPAIKHEQVLDDIPVLPKEVEISDVLGVWSTTSWTTRVRKVSEPQAPVSESLPAKETDPGCVEGESWDALYDENGELLQTEALEELTLAVGQVSILEKPTSSYENFVDDVTYKDDDDMNHILEIYDFPATFKTEDLFCVLGNATSSKSGFDVRWVDDTHALVVFASHLAAKDAQAKNTGLAKLRPLAQATRESRLRAKKMSDSLTPWKPRPQTSISMARRMVTSALGLRSALTPAQRQKDTEEKRRLAQARADRKMASQQRENAWEGHIS